MSALIAVVLLAVLLPLAGAAAGPVGSSDDVVRAKSDEVVRGRADDVVRAKADAPFTEPGPDAKPAEREPAPGLLSGLGLTTAAQCGPELASPEGVEAQTCVLSQGRDTWARTYYRNATGEALTSVLTLMGPEGRTVQMHCAVDEGDEPGACETPREPTAGGREAYSAVAEFAAQSAEGDESADATSMLLRSGSNQAPAAGS